MNENAANASPPERSHFGPEGNGTGGTTRALDDKRILDACVKPQMLADLVKLLDIPKSTLHRKLKRLCRKGLLRYSSGFYQTVQHPAGIASKALLCTPARDRMEKFWPFITYLPTPEQQAFVKLLILGVIARAHNLGHDSHSAFCFLGGTQLLKSTICEMICLALGADLTKCRVNMMQVRGRGLLVRLSSKGEVVWVSEALQEPIAWLEEVSMSAPEIERDLYAFLHGSKHVKIENNTVEVSAVGLLEMNPVKREGALTERIGMEPQRIRRMIVLDVDRLEITDAMRIRCREALERMRSMQPIELPPPASGKLSAELTALVLQTFRSCLKSEPEIRDLFDPGRVLVFIAAARGLMDDYEACRYVLRLFFTVAATTDSVVPDWAVRLDAAFPVTSAPSVPTPVANHTSPGLSVAASDPELSEVLDACANTDQPNPYVQASVEAQLVDLLSELGLRLPEDAGLVHATLSAGRKLASQRVKPDAFPVVISRAGELHQRELQLQQQGIDDAALQQLLRLDQELRAHGIGPQQVPGFLRWHVAMGLLGLTPELIHWFVREVNDRIQQGMLPEDARADWLRLAQGKWDMESAYQRMQRRVADRQARLEKLREQKELLLQKIAQADTELRKMKALIQATKELIDELKRSTEQRKRILDEYGDMLDSVRADLDCLRQAREEARDALRN